MDTSFENKKDEIIKKIRSKGPNLKCPVCSHSDFVLIDGYFTHDVQENLEKRIIGRKGVPVVPLVCEHCGFILEFAAGKMGILPDKN